MKQTILIFTKKKFIKDMGKESYKKNKSWVNKCNGGIVKFNSERQEYITGKIDYMVLKQWCITKTINI
jgi:hypothetical protein